VVAAAADRGLAALGEEDLLRAATRDRRTLVTENAKDFDRIIRVWAAVGEHHGGVVLTSPRHYQRASKAYPGNLVRALAELLDRAPHSTVDLVLWLT
jgi:hypothetical protein